MSIYLLDEEPHLAAWYIAPAHARRMLVEVTRVLCTARPAKTASAVRYAPSSSVFVGWARESLANYKWLYYFAAWLENGPGARTIPKWALSALDELEAWDRLDAANWMHHTEMPRDLNGWTWPSCDMPGTAGAVEAHRIAYALTTKSNHSWRERDAFAKGSEPSWWPRALRKAELLLSTGVATRGQVAA